MFALIIKTLLALWLIVGSLMGIIAVLCGYFIDDSLFVYIPIVISILLVASVVITVLIIIQQRVQENKII